MKKRKVILLLASVCLFSASCRKSANKSENVVLEYSISFDELVHYLPPNGPIIKNTQARSGIYCLMSDSTHVYNAVFESKIQDIVDDIPPIIVTNDNRKKSESHEFSKNRKLILRLGQLSIPIADK